MEARVFGVAILCTLLLLAGAGLRRRLPWLADSLWCAASGGLIVGSVAAVHPAALIPGWLGIGVAFLAAIFVVVRLDLRSGLSVVLIGLAGALIVTGLAAPGSVLLPGLLLWACLWDRLVIAWIVVALIVSITWRAASGDPGDAGAFLGTLASLAVLLVLPPWLAQWGSARPQAWSAVSAVAWVGLFWIFGRVEGGLVEPWRGAAALGCAGIALLLALPGALRLRRDPESAVARATVAPLLAASAFLAAVALPFELERAWKGIGCALAAPAVAWLAARLRDGRLRAVAVLLLGASIVWLFADRAELVGEAGPLARLYALGLPVLALGVAAWQLRRPARR
ncbi:MAG TPA: hypothetical protein VGQ28_01530, partial [Thermoanaerobaculia bacterium]|nr:hypothetical protein [Thermoanaerobaculia bacterium]